MVTHVPPAARRQPAGGIEQALRALLAALRRPPGPRARHGADGDAFLRAHVAVRALEAPSYADPDQLLPQDLLTALLGHLRTTDSAAVIGVLDAITVLCCCARALAGGARPRCCRAALTSGGHA